ncbi:hypothetical protein FB567DRAFT_612174, partial [Paraphoma chrysanthemicola]
AVSIRFLKMVPKWFEEQNVVLPWNARRKADQDRLKTLGLLPHNFPLVYPGHQPDPTARVVHAPSRPAKKAGPKRAPKKVVVQQAAANDPAEDSDSNADDTASDTSNISDSSEDEDEEEVEITLPGRMCDRIRAAHNHFGNDLMSLRFHEDVYTVNKSAFIRSCHTFADLDPETKGIKYTPTPKASKPFSPELVRAFLTAISPCPGKRLPRHDYIFHARKADQTKHLDVLGVMNTAAVSVEKIDWTVPKLVQLRALSVIFECDVLQDMIVAELHQLYAKHCQFGTPFCLASLCNFVNELDLMDAFDRPLIKWCVDVIIDYNASEPYEFTDAMQALFDS